MSERGPAGALGSARGWAVLAAVVLALAVVSLLTNATTAEQLSGRADGVLTLRWTLSRIVNAGTVWAGLAVLAGWLVARPLGALVAGPISGVASLAAHYGIGQLTGLMPAGSASDNLSWFVAALLTGPPLGLVGWLARRDDLLGLLARLVVPLGAVLEPILLGWFAPHALATQPDRISGWVAGGVLVLAGLVGGAVVLRRRQRVASRTFGSAPG
ncbi:hypothetical protein GCM10022199_08440 [Marihabitans asiaticum]|uniref:Uncharacterized protein n=1 Tax=Marihabitans asiaticum TaxID=415218 RepID=A0A560WGS6_9MICO|nr:hypothetical protein [Marihabitans asiaticum]TWD16872.1 hypothetical protein FB557_0418 [Marihabitans asiaticum]